ncbi:TetR/AcrR family transcriptional regulator [Actinomadura rupiterrae]|uniref:TetR/AcrR family transcriptional regulator n=1 Tax=Actinomadura rupiterrae TaxID=559627 RepID=UPI0020A3FA91|nr:TetR/AcrR family transcriptional regulator [Actinomadura rupiterrae]MCP2340824.1 AcrR family transcriptional regulator [Actinomadura rupiterrae]
MPDRPMRADARRNYERLLAAARDVVAEQGTDASLEEVARRAGVGIGTLYRHFPTREALLEALLHDRFDGLRAHAEELLGAGDPFEALADWLRRLGAGALTYQGLAQAMMSAIQDESSDLYASCHGMRAAGEALLVRAQKAGQVRPEVEPLDALYLAAMIASATERSPADPELRDRLFTFMLDGLRPR